MFSFFPEVLLGGEKVKSLYVFFSSKKKKKGRGKEKGEETMSSCFTEVNNSM